MKGVLTYLRLSKKGGKSMVCLGNIGSGEFLNQTQATPLKTSREGKTVWRLLIFWHSESSWILWSPFFLELLNSPENMRVFQLLWNKWKL